VRQANERIYQAQRAGLKNRIRDEWHVLEERAASLLDEWDQEATRRGLAPGQNNYWPQAEAWIYGRIGGSASLPGETAG
jgi:hypothetical protein